MREILEVKAAVEVPRVSYVRRARRPFGEVQVIVMGDADHGTGWRAAMDRRRFLSGHLCALVESTFP